VDLVFDPRNGKHRRRGLSFPLLYSLASSVIAAGGMAEKPSEYEVKAVYLYNFAKFVQWPAGEPSGETDAFTVCVLGEDPFGRILDFTLAGETLHGKKTATKRIERARDARGCRIVFVSGSEERRIRSVLGALKGMNVLTVSDMDDFAERGGMIQLVMDEDRVRFEVNLTVATSEGLEMSSELLKVARGVKKGSRFLRASPTLPGLARAHRELVRGGERREASRC
jgi:hypothetical protein